MSDYSERKAAREQEQATALAEWQKLLRKSWAGSSVLQGLLDLHKPYLDSSYVSLPACDHCDRIGGIEREGVPWPCATYTIIRDGMA